MVTIRMAFWLLIYHYRTVIHMVVSIVIVPATHIPVIYVKVGMKSTKTVTYVVV